MAILAVAAAASIGLNLQLIPSEGFVGAAQTSALVHTGLAAALMAYASRVLPARLPLSAVLRWLAYVVLLVIGLFALMPLLTSDLRTAVGLAAIVAWIGLAAWGTGLIKLLRG